jgi:hypothetical protein
MKDYLSDAILKLKPNSQFVYYGSDYSTIKWDVLDGDAPTQAEIDVAIEQVRADEIAEAEAKATAKVALLSKLGITAEEAQLLLGGN